MTDKLREAAQVVKRLEPFVHGMGKSILEELKDALAQQDAQAVVDAIRAEPTEMIHKWRVLEILQGQVPTPPALSDDERLLRFLLAVRVAGAHLYADDGEMSDCSEQPHIDFKRDSVKEIERKLIERGMKKAWSSIAEYAAPTPPAQRVMLTDEEIRDLWSWSMTAEAERTASTQQHAFARAVIEAYKIKNGLKP